MLYNGGHADFKDRVGEKHGVRGAERGLSPTPPGWRLSGEEWADFPTDCDVFDTHMEVDLLDQKFE